MSVIRQPSNPDDSLSKSAQLVTCMNAFKDRLSFIHLCSFISLHDKLARLQHLDKSIKQLFDPSSCCRNDALYVMLFRCMPESFDITLTRCAQQLKLFSSMPRVTIHFEVVPDTHETKKLKQQAKSVRHLVAQSMIQLARNDTLESLVICESDDTVSLGVSFLQAVKKLKTKRTKLKTFNWEISDDYCKLNEVNFSGLALCTSLTSIIWRFIHGPHFHSNEIETMLRHLPPSLQHITMQLQPNSCMDDDETFCWDTILKSNVLLPNVRTLIIEGNHSPFSVKLLANTIMKQTKKVRPIACLQLGPNLHEYADSSLALLGKMNTIVSLNITTAEVAWVHKLNGSSLPLLRSFSWTAASFDDGYFMETDDDETGNYTKAMFPVLCFLAMRPIESLTLFLPDFLLSGPAASVIASMKRLRSFRTNGALRGHQQPLMKLLPSNTWPELTVLEARVMPDTLETILKAAPCLRSVKLGTHDPATLALVGRYCPLIQSITLDSRHCYDAESYGHASDPLEGWFETSFSTHMSSVAFQHLIRLDMRHWRWHGLPLTAQAMHFLLTKLKRASQLTTFLPAMLRGEGSQLLEYMIVNILPQVQELWPVACTLGWHTYSQPNDNFAPKFRELAHVPVEKWTELGRFYRRMNGENIPDVNADTLAGHLQQLADPLKEEDIIAQTHDYEFVYYRISNVVDASGNDGRHRLMSVLMDKFSPKEKEILRMLEDGEYDNESCGDDDVLRNYAHQCGRGAPEYYSDLPRHLLDYDEDDDGWNEDDDFDDFDEDDEDDEDDEYDDDDGGDFDECIQKIVAMASLATVASQQPDFDDLPELIDKKMLRRKN